MQGRVVPSSQPPSNSQVSRPEVITHFYPLTNLVDSIFSEMDKVNITLLMLFDMSSTFDTIDHIIRVKRLHSLGGIKQALCCGGFHHTFTKEPIISL